MKPEISILINGKERRYSDCKENKEAPLPSTEIAATIEEVRQEGYTLLSVPLKKNELSIKRKKMTLLPNNRTGFTFHQKGKGKPLSKQILAAIMAAVATGTVFGLLVLMVFSSDITEAGNTQPENAAVQKKKSEPASKLVKLPPIKLEFSALQAGVFSSEERAKDVATSIESKGFSAIILPSEEKFSVIVGIANEPHQLERYSNNYQKEMEKPHAKMLTYSFEDLTTPNNLDETYFSNGKILLQNVLTLSQLPATSETGLDQTLSDFNKWKEYGKKQQGNWKKETAKAAKDFEKQLEGAFLALKDTKKGKMNWAFQQKAMDSFKSYNQLLQTLR
ncbi:hypothetical protein KUV80_01515 [Fictibacillus nanhaiensis]|uniref:hypothetical protein n=1 Tax=Fictibacillus nanhaiensis TaxID=742169 RepID=UPI001C966F7D|nr:hypothetical protein [Fictibacillus nanhaiensis]MBY6035311.1 hypothetical protein [Fictibacillus nanhaiensis]